MQNQATEKWVGTFALYSHIIGTIIEPYYIALGLNVPLDSMISILKAAEMIKYPVLTDTY